MKGVIMAGGKGTRLRPLTYHMPKPMVPLLHTPVMEYSIELLKKHGITEIAVTTGYLAEDIKQYFGDGSSWGVNLSYFDEISPLGTAGSVKNAEAFLDETFVVISGDILTDFNLSDGINFHDMKKSTLTILMKEVENPSEYGILTTNSDGRVNRFLEKPKCHEIFSDLINTGIYIVNPSIFSLIPQGECFDFSKDLFPLLIEQEDRVYGYLTNGYWSDIGTLPQYKQTRYDLLNDRVNFNVSTKIAK
ncbi:mannose-1-phosphate guanylyltransferase / phosphomannomutase [Litchfieldia salsa]|uniref:Mannose-1-phosphate guanylyltransferase / phosphomannomutase n=1 Tax=Litchfieldia salsa TaxID=930152 RepID=A0A1H0VBX2_9BACI|nr:nucleotidyltransferase family protein [Litchfieldia salsa]SDP75853.1 mannose-1-phosphate guanylyltransferase / phosphomannomutase [Litchfieldia salsa]